MTRAEALAFIAYTAFHGDEGRAIDLSLAHRILAADYAAAFERGQESKQDGVQCGCVACKRAQTAALLERTGM